MLWAFLDGLGAKDSLSLEDCKWDDRSWFLSRKYSLCTSELAPPERKLSESKGVALVSTSKHIFIVPLNQTGKGTLYLYKLAIKGATCKRLAETSTLSGNLFPFNTSHCSSTKQCKLVFLFKGRGKKCDCEKNNKQTHYEVQKKKTKYIPLTHGPLSTLCHNLPVPKSPLPMSSWNPQLNSSILL